MFLTPLTDIYIMFKAYIILTHFSENKTRFCVKTLLDLIILENKTKILNIESDLFLSV